MSDKIEDRLEYILNQQREISAHLYRRDSTVYRVLATIFVIALACFVGWQEKEIYDARKTIDELNNKMNEVGAISGDLKKEIREELMQTFRQDIEEELQKGVEQMSKIYTYDLDKTLRGVKIDEFNREFEAKIKVLNEEVESAKKKIASLKEGKDKDNFSEVYLKSLKFKRDTMLQEYNGTIEKLTTEINRVVTEIAKEKDALVVLDKRIVASQTDNIEDITDEAIKRVKFPRPKFLDE